MKIEDYREEKTSSKAKSESHDGNSSKNLNTKNNVTNHKTLGKFNLKNTQIRLRKSRTSRRRRGIRKYEY